MWDRNRSCHREILRRAGTMLTLLCAAVCPWAVAADSSGVLILDPTDVRIQAGAVEPVEAYLSFSDDVVVAPADRNVRMLFEPELQAVGFYEVSLRWPLRPEIPSATALVDVFHAEGWSRHRLQQHVDGGQWRFVTTAPFDGHRPLRILLSNPSGRPMIVDALRLEYLGTDRPALEISNSTLALAKVGEPYREVLTAKGAAGVLTFLADTELPAGLSLDPDSGVLSGTPVTAEAHTVTFRIIEESGRQSERAFTLTVLPAAKATKSLRLLAPSAQFGEITSQATGTEDVETAIAPLLALISATSRGEWIRVNLNNFSDVWTPPELRPVFSGRNPTPSRLIEAWASFAWDSNRGDLLLFGGGHANYSGNDVYRWRARSRMWERASLPTEVVHDAYGFAQPIDGTANAPTSAHTYDNNIFLPNVDRLLLFGGAAFSKTGGAWLRERWEPEDPLVRTGPFLFDPSRAHANKVGGTTGSHVRREGPYPEIEGGQMWQNRDIYENIPGEPGFPNHFINGTTDYFDDNGVDTVFITGYNGGLYRYTVPVIADPSQDGWEKLGRYFEGVGGQGAGAYIDHLNIYVKMTGKGFAYWDLDPSKIGPYNPSVRFTPEESTGEFSQAGGQYGIDYDPTRRQLLLWSGGPDVWVLTPPEVVSRSGWVLHKAPTPSSPGPSTEVYTGVLGKWRYIAQLDSFVGLGESTAGEVWVYRPADDGSPGPGGGDPDSGGGDPGSGGGDPGSGGQNPDQDSDTDGLPDHYELQFGLDPLDPTDAAKDFDGDTFTSHHEFLVGTAPDDPSSFPESQFMEVGQAAIGPTSLNFPLLAVIPDPIVVLGPPSFNDPNPGAVSLVDVSSSGFGASFQNWQYLQQPHATELVPYLAIQRGEHELADGTRIAVGTFLIDGHRSWTPIVFQNPFPSVPYILLTLQTSDDDTPVTIRARNLNNLGFEAALFEEEAKLDGHAIESAGFIAIWSSTSTPSLPVGTGAAAIQLQQSDVGHQWQSVFTDVELILQEEQSRDLETYHPKERLSVLRIHDLIFAQDVLSQGGNTVSIRQRQLPVSP